MSKVHVADILDTRPFSPCQVLVGVLCFCATLLGFGAGYRPTDKWTMDFDVERYGWSSFDTSYVVVGRQVPAAGFTNIVTPLDWKDSYLLRIGAEYKLTDSLALRGGLCIRTELCA